MKVMKFQNRFTLVKEEIVELREQTEADATFAELISDGEPVKIWIELAEDLMAWNRSLT